MSEEKDLLENEIEETAAEVVDTIEEVVEDAYEIIEEVAEAPEEAIEIVEKADLSKQNVAIISAAITFLVCVIIGCILYFTTFNSYNMNKDGYVTTLAEIAEMNDMSLSEFKEEWGLPSNMRGNTTMESAQAYIPTAKFLEMSYGMTFEQFADIIGITEEDGVDENSPWGKTQKIMNQKTLAAQNAPENETTEDAAAEGEQAPAENAEATE